MSFQPKFIPRVKVYEGSNPGVPSIPYGRSTPREVRTQPVPKVLPKRSRKYREWVASLPCIQCSLEKSTQCAHADMNKGTGTKTSDETCFPLCVGCHASMGSGAEFDKQERRDREAIYGARTRLRAMAEGVFPKGWM